jgi:hypothetical protein
MKYCFTLFFVLLLGTGFGQQVKPANINDFVSDCTRSNGNGANRQLAIWFPAEFWQIANAQNKDIPPALLQNIVDEMKEYMMFCVVDYTISGTDIQFTGEDEIRRSIRLIDSSKTIYVPLEEDDISSTASALINSLKPMMAQLVGQFGEGMRVVLFKAKKINGKPAIDITRKNSFTLELAKHQLKWSMPFGSLMPPKYCPIDKEIMKGNWEFCPEHGVKLEK